jgi:hypothetical protein
MEDKWNAYRALVGKPEIKRLVGRPRRELEDNIKMGIRKIWWDSMDWVHLAQDRDQWRALVNSIMNFQVTQNVVKFLNGRATVGFSKTQLHGVYGAIYIYIYLFIINCNWAYARWQ